MVPNCSAALATALSPLSLPKSDSSVPVARQPLDRACAGRALPKRNMRSHLVIIELMIAGPEGGRSSDMQRYEG